MSRPSRRATNESATLYQRLGSDARMALDVLGALIGSVYSENRYEVDQPRHTRLLLKAFEEAVRELSIDPYAGDSLVQRANSVEFQHQVAEEIALAVVNDAAASPPHVECT